MYKIIQGMRKFFYLLNYFVIRVENGKRLNVGKGFATRKGFSVRIDKKAYVHIGKNVFFNNAVSINAKESIEIGDNCIFGENVKMYDHNHRFNDSVNPVDKQGYRTEKIKIGSNCWVGSNVVILPGTILGDNCVVGAGVVVSGQFPSDSMIKLKRDIVVEAIRRDTNV